MTTRIELSSKMVAMCLPTHMTGKRRLDMDTMKIRRGLGYRETMPRREALERNVAWDRQHPPKEVDPAQFDYAAEDAILSRAMADQ